MFDEFFDGRRVLVFGHTGFKGSWLCEWLLGLGARVWGMSSGLPSDPCHFELLGLAERLGHLSGDVRNPADVAAAFDLAEPQVVFHLAAEAIVLRCIRDPVGAFATNTMGTVHVLDELRRHTSLDAAVIVTSDKCYENKEQLAGYAEGDRLGGGDPYSASKAAAELAFSAYQRTFFAGSGPPAATARAGNVIGGGDWAAHRLVPDAVGAWAAGQPLRLRHPQATRPWQHVLEPVSGYLWLAVRLAQDPGLGGASFNFGPREGTHASVQTVTTRLARHWPGAQVRVEPTSGPHEAGLLALDVGRARQRLGWSAVLDLDETLVWTAGWYRGQAEGEPPRDLTSRQIASFARLGAERGLPWA